MRTVEMHDGSMIQLRKLETDYDPTDRMGAFHRLQWAQEKQEFITGLIYYDPNRPSLAEVCNLGETPLAQVPNEKLRPRPEALTQYMQELAR